MTTANLAKQLKEQATKFEDAARKLREAAEILGNTGNGSQEVVQEDRSSGGTRIEQIAEFLRKKGPSLRRDVFAGLDGDVPRGTLSALLNSKNFDQDDEGRWSARKG